MAQGTAVTGFLPDEHSSMDSVGQTGRATVVNRRPKRDGNGKSVKCFCISVSSALVETPTFFGTRMTLMTQIIADCPIRDNPPNPLHPRSQHR
jgi:hypothetical protein